MRKVFAVICLRLKLISRKPLLFFLSLILPFTFYFFAAQIIKNSSEDSKIPIAVVDMDNSKSSKKVVEGIKDNEVFRCYVTNSSTAMSMLKKELVQGVYILKNGLENQIFNNNSDWLIDVYYVKGNKIAPAMTDIISGEIVPLFSKNIGANYAEKLFNSKKLDGVDIKVKVESLYDENYNSNRFELPQNVSIKLPKGEKSEGVQLSLSNISNQWILGMFIIFLSLFIVFNCGSFINERKNKLRSRMLISGCSSFQILLGDVVGIVTIGMLLNLISITLFNSVMNIKLDNIFIILLIYFVYTVCITNILIFISGIFSGTVSFQSFVPIFIFFIGLFGGCFFSLEFLPIAVKNIAYFTPTYWAQLAFNNVALMNFSFSSVSFSLEVLIVYSLVFFNLNWGFIYKANKN